MTRRTNRENLMIMYKKTAIAPKIDGPDYKKRSLTLDIGNIFYTGIKSINISLCEISKKCDYRRNGNEMTY